MCGRIMPPFLDGRATLNDAGVDTPFDVPRLSLRRLKPQSVGLTEANVLRCLLHRRISQPHLAQERPLRASLPTFHQRQIF
jgi:hypothetical protein